MAKRKIDEQISYNWLFFLLAGGFAAVTAWAVYDETVTRREYKTYQEAFFKIERDLNREKVEKEKAALEQNAEYKKLEARKKELEDEVRARREEIARIEAELQEAGFSAFDKTQTYTFSKSELDEAYYYFTLAKHDHKADPDDPVKKAAYEEKKKIYEDLVARTKRDEQVMFEHEAKKKAIQEKLDEAKHSKELAEITKQMEAIRRPYDEAVRAYEKSVQKLSGLFGPATEIVQQNLPEIEKVDRCQSCHLGAARGGFETVAQKEFRSHPFRRVLLAAHPPEKFGCTTCHDGQGRATTKFYAHAPGADEDPHAFHKHYWEFPLLKGPPKVLGGDGTEYMESKCRGCHQKQWDLRAELPCEVDAECPLGADGKPLKCDVPKPRASQGAPHGSVEEAEKAAKFAELVASGKARAPEPVKMCLDPKTKRAQLVDLAPNLSRGLKIIEEVGCYGCHPIDGYLHKPKPAPELTRIALKADPAWMIEWIKDPKAFRPNTRMPRFWPELLKPEDYPYPVDVEALEKKRQEEATAMAAFLLSQSKASKKYAFELAPIPVQGDAQRGEKLVAELGCAGCHNVPVASVKLEHKNRASHFDHGPDLSNVGAKTTKQWIYNWVKDPKRFSPTTRMPNLRLTDQEAADVAEFLSRQTGGKSYASARLPNLEDPALVQKGKELVKYYGCFGCHLVEGFEETPGIGAELTEFGLKTTERLDFGDYITDHNQQTWDAWTMHKLKHPRVYAYERAEMRMPQFDLTDDEIRAVMVVLKGMRGSDTKEVQVLARKLSPQEEAREAGREIVRTYNCFGCHTIDGFEGDLRQLSQYRGPNAKYGPPILDGTGEKTQPSWLFGFLKRPFPLRPLPKVRMPTFGFDDAKATTLVAMFSALDKAEYPFNFYADVKPATSIDYKVGQALFESTGCQKCHLVGEPGGDVPPDVVAPNLVLAKQRLRAEWITRWLADPNALQNGTAMPAFWLGANNPLDLALKNDPRAQTLLSGIDPAALKPFVESKERQMAAVRDFLFVLTASGATPPITADAR